MPRKMAHVESCESFTWSQGNVFFFWKDGQSVVALGGIFPYSVTYVGICFLQKLMYSVKFFFLQTDVYGDIFYRIIFAEVSFCTGLFIWTHLHFQNGIHENIFRRTCIGNGDVFSPKMTHTDIFADGMTYVTCFRAQPLWGYLFIPKGVRADIFSCKITYSEGLSVPDGVRAAFSTWRHIFVSCRAIWHAKWRN